MFISAMRFEHASAQERAQALETGTFHGKVQKTRHPAAPRFTGSLMDSWSFC